SPDKEVARRVVEILDYFDRNKLRNLQVLIKNGDIEKTIETIAHWPAGNNDDEIWERSRDLARHVALIHEKNSGAKIRAVSELEGLRTFFHDMRATETRDLEHLGRYFLRCGEADIDFYTKNGKGPSSRFTLGEIFIVADKSVRLKHS